MGGTGQDCRWSTARQDLGRMRGRLSVRPPPVMWLMPLRGKSREQVEHGFHVDAGGLEEFFAQGAPQ